MSRKNNHHLAMPVIYRRFLQGLILVLPPLLFFSYYPIISLGASDSMNFELSLPLLWLPLFFLATLPYAVRAFKNFKISTLLIGCALPLFVTISLLWSANFTRALLTAGIYWLITYAVFMLIFLLNKSKSPLFKPPRSPKTSAQKTAASSSTSVSGFIRLFWRVFFISSLLICLFCWAQCLLDILGVYRDQTLLCLGCTYQLFGFPHPSGFAIEPQFMGNLLLAPTLASLYFLCQTSQKSATQSAKSPKNRFATLKNPLFASKSARTALLILSGLFSATLFLTFSRGAIYAFAVALLILCVFTLKRHIFRPSLLLVPLCAFGFTLGCQGVFATLGPTSDNFFSATTKSIHHLSLGAIDLRPDTTSDDVQTTAEETTSTYSGYVSASTDIRLDLTSLALQVWSESPTSVIFGVGLGSAGTVLHQHGLTTTPKEIVQNEYASILLELGVIGLLLALALIIFIYRQFWRATSEVSSEIPSKIQKSEITPNPLLIALFTAYLITLCFFSGPTNALQIYLLPPLFWQLFRPAF